MGEKTIEWTGLRWNIVIKKIRGRLRTSTVYKEYWRVQDRRKRNKIRMEKLAPRKIMKKVMNLDIYGGLLQ